MVKVVSIEVHYCSQCPYYTFKEAHYCRKIDRLILYEESGKIHPQCPFPDKVE